VLAGPVEATAIGNLVVQSMAAGGIASIDEGRRLVAASFRPVRYEPRAHASQRWVACAKGGVR
jgi:rhamnulokinase